MRWRRSSLGSWLLVASACASPGTAGIAALPPPLERRESRTRLSDASFHLEQEDPASGSPSQWIAVKGGYYDPDGSDRQNDGWSVFVSWNAFERKFLGLEIETGYVRATAESGDATVWAVPLTANLYLAFPLSAFDVYLGGGLGVLYYDVNAGSSLSFQSENGGWPAASGFAGLRFYSSERITLGVEAEYFFTDEIDDLERQPLNGYAILLTTAFGW